MATVTGLICDVCERFAVKKVGWMRLTTSADTDNKGFDVCSNVCLGKLARERRFAETSMNGEVKQPSTSKYSFTTDEKRQLVKEAEETSFLAVAQKYGVPYQALGKWKQDVAI